MLLPLPLLPADLAEEEEEELLLLLACFELPKVPKVEEEASCETAFFKEPVKRVP
jgi:hypothetical protein